MLNQFAKKTLFTAVAALSVAALSPVVASADESWRVDPGDVGLFEHADYWGWLGSRTPFFWRENVSLGANDSMSSWINKSNSRNSWWEHANGAGFCRPMVPQYWAPTVYANENDRLSSWGTNSTVTGC